MGRFRNGGQGFGPAGVCWCPACGYREAHTAGQPCFLKPCPKCGGRMTREVGSVVQGLLSRR